MKPPLARIKHLAANCMLWFFCCVSSVAADSLPIYFYNPETNIDRNATLKQKLDTFLASKGNFRLQPVKDRKAFVQLVTNETFAAYMMPSWLYKDLSSLVAIKAKLVGIKNQTPYYKKLLILHNSLKLKSIDKLIIASTGTPSYAQSLLNSIQATSNKRISSNQLLMVPKDLDALLSVGFGMAQASLSTEDSLNQLAKLYSNQYQQLAIVGESSPLMRLMLVTPEQLPPQYRTLINNDLTNAIALMDTSKEGKIALSLLGLDSWITYQKATQWKADSIPLSDQKEGK